MPIFALTSTLESYHQMALYWGVIPVPPCPTKNVQEAFEYVKKFAENLGFIQKNDIVLITAGAPFGVSGTTNTMLVEIV
jgi:pyruvate kinase